MTTQMSQILTAAYGQTQPGSTEQQEKVAVANAIAKLAAADNLDLNTLNEQELGVVYSHYLGELQKMAADEGGEPPKKEEEEKENGEDKGNGMPPQFTEEEKKAAAELQEADFLGRQMARSFVDELAGIQKAAAAQQQPEQQLPESVVKLAQARAEQFLQEKIAAGQLCVCGDPNCNGSCETAKTAAAQQGQAQMSQDDVINQVALQMLVGNGYERLLQQ